MVDYKADHAVWRRLGEIATDVFALGWHQDQSKSVQFFLAESRKRLFTAAYRSDKSLASFLGRPPRIPKRYCTLVMPFDLGDADLMKDEP
jgi:Fungal specific transcription factor domain.